MSVDQDQSMRTMLINKEQEVSALQVQLQDEIGRRRKALDQVIANERLVCELQQQVTESLSGSLLDFSKMTQQQPVSPHQQLPHGMQSLDSSYRMVTAGPRSSSAMAQRPSLPLGGSGARSPPQQAVSSAGPTSAGMRARQFTTRQSSPAVTSAQQHSSVTTPAGLVFSTLAMPDSQNAAGSQANMMRRLQQGSRTFT